MSALSLPSPEEIPTYNSHTEPADPADINQSRRRDTRLAPNGKVSAIPKPFVTCECGSCPDIVDPLYDGECEIQDNRWAKEECDSPEVMTYEKAQEVYIRYQRSRWQTDGQTSKYERHRYQYYPRMLNADRYFQQEYDDLTTVLLTRRVDPKSTDRWRSPYVLDMALHDQKVMQSVRNALDYHLGDKMGLDFEWLRVTAPTKSAATPHEHRYLWIDDPDNVVTVDHIKPALEKHLEHCVFAKKDNHPVDDGDSGAVTIRHTPPRVDEEYKREGDILHTLGIQYLASQLPHLQLGDVFDAAQNDPKEQLLEGGAVAWITPSKWFGTSSGVSTVGN